ncbi:reverse transcriptase [Abeliophyllum distichum]|uniref:Reverse transcriptase n=1 Tax=Abeliophyllum distichum TaxID=126358 RepID=A0ABD1TJW2_9LAMI
MTLRRGKLFDNQVGISKRNTSQSISTGSTPTDDSVQEAPKENNAPSYIPKVPFPHRLRSGIMQLSFDNMTIELNVFNVNKQPHDNEDVANVDMIEAIVDDSFVSINCDVALNMCLPNFGSYFDVDSAINEVNVLLELVPVMDAITWKQKIEPLPTSENKNIPSVPTPPSKLKLKELPDTLKYVFLGKADTLPVDEKVEVFVVRVRAKCYTKIIFLQGAQIKIF